MRISGGRGYDLTFTVGPDDLGMYRGSFGSTAPGTHSIEASSGLVRASAALVTAR